MFFEVLSQGLYSGQYGLCGISRARPLKTENNRHSENLLNTQHLKTIVKMVHLCWQFQQICINIEPQTWRCASGGRWAPSSALPPCSAADWHSVWPRRRVWPAGPFPSSRHVQSEGWREPEMQTAQRKRERTTERATCFNLNEPFHCSRVHLHSYCSMPTALPLLQSNQNISVTFKHYIT